MQIKRLFEPVTIGNVELKNRLVMLGIGTHFAENERITQRLTDFLIERAKGGAGLMFLGTVFPSDLGIPGYGNIGLYSDEFISEMRRLTDTIHRYDAKIGAQILLRYQWRGRKDAPLDYVAPSEMVTGPGINPPRAITIEEIHQIVDEYGEAARRAREAGFDTVDICCIAGYLLNRFLSPLTNKRTDEYGGSLENRARFLIEVMESARKKAGKDFTLMCRLTIEDFMKGGMKVEDSKKVAAMLEETGVSGIIMYAGWHECPTPTSQSSVPDGAFVYMAEALKQAVRIPIVATNRINDPILAERVLAEGKADLVGMARSLIADPAFPDKAREGRLEDICPCICCNHCLDLAVRGKPMACSVNPWVGREGELPVQPAKQPGKVFVIGGGPAGMEAAVVAAEMGHKVTLWEKSDMLGGQLIAASVPPYKKTAGFRDYMANLVEKSGVKTVLGKEATAKLIEGEKPDAVIVATGASPIIPSIPGVNGANVVTALDVLLGKKETGKRIIIVGGGMVGCETAEYLAEKGKTVTILEMLERAASDVGVSTRWVLLKRLRQSGVEIKTGAKVVEITDKGAKVESNGASQLFEGDTVVLAVGLRANNRLFNELTSKVDSVCSIGDCAGVGKIAGAVEAGLQAARQL